MAEDGSAQGQGARRRTVDLFTLNRFVRIADGPDEVHMSQLGKSKIKDYVAMNER